MRWAAAALVLLAGAVVFGPAHGSAAGEAHAHADTHAQAAEHDHRLRRDAAGVPVHHCRSIISDKAGEPVLPAGERPGGERQPGPAQWAFPAAMARSGRPVADPITVDPPPKRPPDFLATARLRL